jgi:single-stranded-DNA-specific exonuclease
VTTDWVTPSDGATAAADRLSSALGISLPLARVLAARDVDDPLLAKAFLRPTLDQLHDPMLLPDMANAVDRLTRAIDGNETILVHGDFDADGMCAAAAATLGLRRLGAAAVGFVPHRTRDGYDLGQGGIDRAMDIGASLILTVDCGVTALESVARAADRGIEVVVTDHHRPGPSLPDAVAVVNPAREDSRYPFAGLSGAGVAFKLVAALFSARGIPDSELNQYLDLVAIGTVADQMPLRDENRALTRAGLRVLSRTRRPGLRALLSVAGIDLPSDARAEDIAYRIAPRLNSAGRMAEAESGLQLLLTESESEAESLARLLDQQNAERRTADRAVTREVEDKLAGFDPGRDGAAVVWGDGWHPGVVGIVASRVVDRWHRPAVVVAFDGSTGRGSGRSIEGFHLFDALRECEPLLERFGGHQMAAGFTIERSNIETFADRLRCVAARRLDNDLKRRRLAVDLELTLADATFELLDALEHLRPFGNENPAPVLAVRSVGFESASVVGELGAHLRAVMRSGNVSLRAIGFGLGDRLDDVRTGHAIDVAFHLRGDVWSGRRRLQAEIIDIQPAGAA